MRVIVEDRKIGAIPVLEVYDWDAAAPKPAVLVLHGLGGCKENNLRDAYYLVKAGFFVSLFDAYGHGEWQDGAARKLSRTERIGDLPNIIMNTAQMIADLIANLRDRQRADYNRVGLLGRSMGGMIIYAYLTGERSPSVTTAVLMATSPAWQNLYYADPDAPTVYDADQLSWFEENEPCRKLHKLPELPLLLLNGVQDPKMPIADVRKSFLEMRRYYQEQDRVRLIEYETAGHEVIPPMFDEAVAWFRKYL
jgi:alpha-beta hydrolase superfamily lysophospholipase